MDSSYTSCIKIGKYSIIPPLITDELRSEMRYYRELAVLREKNKNKRPSVDSGVMTNSIENEKKVNTFYIRDRRNSYTLETPSPIMLAYVQSLQDQTNFEHKKSSSLPSSSHISPIAVARSCKSAERLNFDENCTTHCNVTETKPQIYETAYSQSQSECNSTNNSHLAVMVRPRNSDEYSKFNYKCVTHDSIDEKKLQVSQNTSNSPSESEYSSNNSHVSPVSVVRSCKSISRLKFDENYATCNTASKPKSQIFQNINDNSELEPEYSKVYHVVPNLNSFEISPEKESSSDSQYVNINDSFNKDFCLLDLSANITNTSHESDTCRESILSDCSSVSLNKFIPSFSKKLPEGQEAEYAVFQYHKEQLEMKFRKQLAELVQEHQKEYDCLKERFSRISSMLLYSKNTSSPRTHSSSYYNSNKYSVSCEKNHKIKFSDEKISNYDEVSMCESVFLKSPVVNKNSDKKQTTKISEKAPIDIKTMDEIATTINAYVRGYLTRRLLKTDRVKLLIQTIRDCLVEAWSLQNESDLDDSESKLKKRFSRQITQCLLEINDIFTSPVNQRMAIIAADREKKKRFPQRGTLTPRPLSEATKRSLLRKRNKSAPAAQRQYTRNRCTSKCSTDSEINSCNGTSILRRPIITTIMSQKYNVSLPNRRPWR